MRSRAARRGFAASTARSTQSSTDRSAFCVPAAWMCVPENCLRLVDLTQVSGDERYDALITQRYGSSAAELRVGQAGAIIKNEEKCIRCGLCADRCPTGAITMEALERQEREVFE